MFVGIDRFSDPIRIDIVHLAGIPVGKEDGVFGKSFGVRPQEFRTAEKPYRSGVVAEVKMDAELMAIRFGGMKMGIQQERRANDNDI